MSPKHVKLWAMVRKAHFEKILVELDTEYANCKILYESQFLPKLFGWKFEESGAGNTSWIGSWDFCHVKSHAEEFDNILREAEYKSKMSYATMKIEKRHEASFYKFCEDSKIPH